MGYINEVDRPKKWVARYLTPEGRRVSKAFLRKADAERWLKAEEGKVVHGTWTDPNAGTVPFPEYAETWLAGLPHDLKPKTRAGYTQHLRGRLIPAFGDARLNQITAAKVRAWQQDQLAEGFSPHTVRQSRQVLGAVLGQAAEDGLILHNPVPRVKAPRAAQRRQKFLTAFELKGLADAADRIQPDAGALVWFLGWSGLRWGEATALRVSDVDLTRRRVRVEQATSDVDGVLHTGPPKTHQARTVILPRYVTERIRPLADGKAPGDLVFTTRGGRPLRASNFRRTWKPALEAAGLDTDLVVHDLRDTAASLMIATGASIKAVQRALGHASAAMTLDVYGGLFEEDLETLADKMEERWGADVTGG